MRLRYIDIFFAMGILLIPFSFQLLSFHQEILQVTFVPINLQIARLIGVKAQILDLSSDTKLFFIQFGIVAVMSFAMMVVIKTQISEKVQLQLLRWIRIIIAYYLALILLKYGFDKLFKAQFPLPEPNLLFTPLGKMDRDILFWSTIGTSHSYSVFMGLAEIIPGILLLFHRTRAIGGFIASAVLLNVVALNFAFDISVKLYGSFLLSLAIYQSFPAIKTLIHVIVQEKIAIPLLTHPASFPSKPFIKSFLILLIFAEALSPYLLRWNFNDDLSPRPLFHGAYSNLDSCQPIKRVFVHRDNFMIFQSQDDEMLDFQMKINPTKEVLILRDYSNTSYKIPFQYNRKSKILSLKLPGQASIQCKRINTKELPLLSGQFHWSVD